MVKKVTGLTLALLVIASAFLSCGPPATNQNEVRQLQSEVQELNAMLALTQQRLLETQNSAINTQNQLTQLRNQTENSAITTQNQITQLRNQIEQLETEKFSLFVDRKRISDLDKELAKLKRPWWKKLVSTG